jgi:transcriptional regulator GlxA family with amidase domain
MADLGLRPHDGAPVNLLRVGILGFDNVTALDLVGPADVFSTASQLNSAAESGRHYEVIIIGLSARPFRSDSGVMFKPVRTLETAPALDTLIIPGGHGLREPATNAKVAAWVKSRAASIRRVATVCTGIYGLAPTGLLDGRRATTHWHFARDVAQKFTAIRVEPNALYLKDGPFYTAAGVTSGIDLCLSLVREDLGPKAALAVARLLVVYLVRAGGQEQYSEPLRFQAQAGDRFSELAAWIVGNLRQDLTVEVLAARAGVCGRHFSRRFKREFGNTPGDFVESLRLGESRRLLSSRDSAIESVADSVGFRSADSFRRAFERRFGITPSGYRGRFATERKAS